MINWIDVEKLSCSFSFNNLWMLPQLPKKNYSYLLP